MFTFSLSPEIGGSGILISSLDGAGDVYSAGFYKFKKDNKFFAFVVQEKVC